MTWLIWIHTHSYTFIHCMPCSFASLLMNCKKNVASFTKLAKRNSALNSLCQKRYIQLTPKLLFLQAVVSGDGGLRHYPWELLRESENPWFLFFLIPWFFWSWKIPKFEKFFYISWKSWKSILMKYNLKSVVNVWYSLPDYSFDDDKRSPDSHISSRKRSHVYSLGFF